MDQVHAICKRTGASIQHEPDPEKAVQGADIVYTDSWMSYRIPHDQEQERIKLFQGYQVTSELMEKAHPDAIFMHCLPAKRGMEVTDDVIDGSKSVVFDQAENRLHTAKSLLCYLMLGDSFLNMTEHTVTSAGHQHHHHQHQHQLHQNMHVQDHPKMRDGSSKRIVIALGGNALQTQTDTTFENMRDRCEDTCRSIAQLIDQGYQVVVTYGNGPQVGSLLLQNLSGHQDNSVPMMPLHILCAMTQAQLGAMIQQGIRNGLKSGYKSRDVVTVVTEEIVDQNDPGFKDPSKPIGPYYDEIPQRLKEMGYRFKQIKSGENRGKYRMIVPSPKPRRMLQGEAIHALLSRGMTVVACGGGGTPVAVDENTTQTHGIDAIIDKDFSSSLLAKDIDAHELIILTNVPSVYVDMKDEEKKRPLERVTVQRVREYIEQNQFEAGSMLPKIEACLDFVSTTGRSARIGSVDDMDAVVHGRAGTLIVRQ